MNIPLTQDCQCRSQAPSRRQRRHRAQGDRYQTSSVRHAVAAHPAVAPDVRPSRRWSQLPDATAVAATLTEALAAAPGLAS
ncbi:MAG: hypothetical protein MZV49_17345 [Rhodopseudomonas palustris]|nr:hypothetical protein [Rhodopseudomonas palustris]